MKLKSISNLPSTNVYVYVQPSYLCNSIFVWQQVSQIGYPKVQRQRLELSTVLCLLNGFLATSTTILFNHGITCIAVAFQKATSLTRILHEFLVLFLQKMIRMFCMIFKSKQLQ